jgi:hypothetical protein
MCETNRELIIRKPIAVLPLYTTCKCGLIHRKSIAAICLDLQIWTVSIFPAYAHLEDIKFISPVGAFMGRIPLPQMIWMGTRYSSNS